MARFARHRVRHRVRGMVVVGGHLHGQLAARPQRPRQPREQPLVVPHPLQRRVREHEVEPLPRERPDVAPLEAQPSARVPLAARQHRRRAVDARRLRRPRAFVQQARERAPTAAQIDRAPARNRAHQREQVVEGPLALGAEARVPLRTPGVAHGREPT